MFARNLFRKFSSAESLVLRENRGPVALLTLNRPKALNALCDDLISELNTHLQQIDGEEEIGAVVITGSGNKAFAAGADIKEMKDKTFPWTYNNEMLESWADMNKIHKPIIAAVNGYALGGGFELALMCDIIYASDNAEFGLPEITLGTIPGCGGTQRLIRECGKSNAMEMILTGNFISSEEARNCNIVSEVVKQDELVDAAIKTATKIANFSQPVIAMAKDTVNQAYNAHLEQGLQYEKRVFWSTFATQDRKEGMTAFAEKRKPTWKNE